MQAVQACDEFILIGSEDPATSVERRREKFSLAVTLSARAAATDTRWQHLHSMIVETDSRWKAKGYALAGTVDPPDALRLIAEECLAAGQRP